MPKFRKKPVVIEAIQFTGGSDNLSELSEFIDRKIAYNANREQILIYTLEGNMIASLGDWIIKGVKGECYPCKPDIFEETYEPVQSSAELKKMEDKLG
jgi:hypothetical protein